MLHVLYSFPTRFGVRGIGMTAWYQVRGMVAQGAQVTLACGSCERPIPGVHRVVETMKIGPLKIPYRLLGHDRPYRHHDRIVARLLRRHKFDLVHCWPSGSLATLERARVLGIVSVLERPSAHTAQVFEAMRRQCEVIGLKLPENHYAATNERRLQREEREFRTTDFLLCPSPFVAETFAERGYEESKLLRHQYGCDPDVFSAPPDLSMTNGRPLRFLYVGQCSPLKGVHVALGAWLSSQTSRVGRFALCGSFVPGFKEALQDRLRHPSIELLGFRSDVHEVMRQFDVLIHPSFSEGSALVTYEARACGLVLLASNAAGAKCEHMKNGLIHMAGDVETLARQIDLLSEDRETLQRLRSASLANLNDLTWASATKRLLECYEYALRVRAPKASPS